MKKIQLQIATFYERQTQVREGDDLMIASLFQALDMRASGRLTKR